MSDDTLGRIAEWCAAATDLDMDGSTVTVAGDPPVAVTLEETGDALVLHHTHAVGEAPEDFAEEARALLGGRGSMIEGDVATDGDSTSVEIRYPIYLDGLNRQTFLLAIRDITGTADGLVGIAAAAPTLSAEPEIADAAPVEADTAATTAPVMEPEPEPVTAETVVVDEAIAWHATHTVPGGGMSAWAEPDPGLAPIAKLVARVELQVTETRGAWARVTGSNGWTGWVDARKLREFEGAGAARIPLTGAAPVGAVATAAAGSGGLTIRPLAMLGGLMMIISAFLPWFRWVLDYGGANQQNIQYSGTDAPLGVLWGNSLTQPALGWILLVLGLLAIAISLLPRVPGSALLAIGGLGALIVIVLTLQIGMNLGNLDLGWGSLFDALRIGAGVALIGSVLAAIPYKLQM